MTLIIIRLDSISFQVLQNDIDLLNPPAELEKKKHKLKRLVQSPNSFFMVTLFTSVSLIICYVLPLVHLICNFIFVLYFGFIVGCQMSRLFQHVSPDLIPMFFFLFGDILSFSIYVLENLETVCLSILQCDSKIEL